ncbi:MAG: nucleotidyltransferase domain-containing protein [Firmicutes bacterium]|nr:nucleotidyltransferase domain-containing protein [Bacillota bacterium]
MNDIGPLTQDLLDGIVKRITAVSTPTRVVLFGSFARGDSHDDSDLDLMVVEPEVTARREKMVRMRRALRDLRIPVDVVVVSQGEWERYRDIKGTIIYPAAHEGKTLFAR